jgi:hypothetical protein
LATDAKTKIIKGDLKEASDNHTSLESKVVALVNTNPLTASSDAEMTGQVSFANPITSPGIIKDPSSSHLIFTGEALFLNGVTIQGTTTEIKTTQSSLTDTILTLANENTLPAIVGGIGLEAPISGGNTNGLNILQNVMTYGDNNVMKVVGVTDHNPVLGNQLFSDGAGEWKTFLPAVLAISNTGDPSPGTDRKFIPPFFGGVKYNLFGTVVSYVTVASNKGFSLIENENAFEFKNTSGRQLTVSINVVAALGVAATGDNAIIRIGHGTSGDGGATWTYDSTHSVYSKVPWSTNKHNTIVYQQAFNLPMAHRFKVYVSIPATNDLYLGKVSMLLTDIYPYS